MPDPLAREVLLSLTPLSSQSVPAVRTRDHLRRVPELDGLRGCAIAMVVALHYFGDLVKDVPVAGPLIGFGWSGVDLFFVLSGFLIGGILLDQRESGRYWSTFFVRRALRILPLYLAVSAGVYLLFHAINRASELPPFFVYPLFAQNLWALETGSMGPPPLAVMWSLAIEEHSYLVLPVLVRLLSRRRLTQVVILGILIVPALRTLLLGVGLGSPAVLQFASRYDPLLMGAFCAIAVRSGDAQEWLVSKRSVLVRCTVLLTAVVLAYIFAGSWLSESARYHAIFAVGFSLIGAFYSCLLLQVVLSQGCQFLAVLRTRGLRYLGKVSFGIYLFHQSTYLIVGGLMRRGGIEEPVATGTLSLVVTLFAAELSFRFFERPLLDRGHRLAY